MVPMAPSSTRMRSCSGAQERGADAGVATRSRDFTPTLKRRLFIAGRKAEQMADRVDEIGAVHGVEVEVADAAVDEIEHLLGGNGGCDQLAGRRVIVEAVEALGEPGRYGGAAARGEIRSPA